MKPDASAIEFATYAASRWRHIGAACLSAVVVAGLAGLLLPKRYTATATLLIELPAATDPRAATAISPVYLDSLKTYEHLASSDSLFAEALKHQGIRAGLKSSILKVSKPANTRILDIAVTLENPSEAQALAQYIAERTAALNRELDARSSADAVAAARAAFETADKRLKAITTEIDRAGNPRRTLDAELDDARTDREVAKAKFDDLNASAALRGERLVVVDPAIVPPRPSFPNTPLNVVAALLISLAGSITYLAFRFGYERASVHRHERVYSRIA